MTTLRTRLEKLEGQSGMSDWTSRTEEELHEEVVSLMRSLQSEGLFCGNEWNACIARGRLSRPEIATCLEILRRHFPEMHSEAQ